jgi:hypothetical protein
MLEPGRSFPPPQAGEVGAAVKCDALSVWFFALRSKTTRCAQQPSRKLHGTILGKTDPLWPPRGQATGEAWRGEARSL